MIPVDDQEKIWKAISRPGPGLPRAGAAHPTPGPESWVSVVAFWEVLRVHGRGTAYAFGPGNAARRVPDDTDSPAEPGPAGAAAAAAAAARA